MLQKGDISLEGELGKSTATAATPANSFFHGLASDRSRNSSVRLSDVERPPEHLIGASPSKGGKVDCDAVSDKVVEIDSKAGRHC